MNSSRLILVCSIIFLLAACRQEDIPLPTAEPTAVPTTIPISSTNSDIDWPPTIISSSPQPGEELPVEGTITLRFDQPMNRDSVEAALSLVEMARKTAVSGTISWAQADTLTFTPDEPLVRQTSYHLRLGAEASGENGLPLTESIEVYFQTSSGLEITQTIPEDGTQDVEADSAITVMFNRPVVPLVSSGQQADLPQPLTFAPTVTGKGEWVSTSMYRFTPDGPLAGATEYHVTIAELTDLSGAVLAGGDSWTFNTLNPDVVMAFPAHESTQVKPTTPLTITFNMPMDRASTETAVSLKSANHTSNLDFAWSDNDQVLTLTPAEMLPLEDTYQLRIDAGASAANGNASLGSNYLSTFTTVPYPGITGIEPANGEIMSDQDYQEVRIYFASPMDRNTIIDTVTIEPVPDNLHRYVEVENRNTSFVADFSPSTQYTVTISGAISDPYGNTLGEDYQSTFFVPEAEPLASLNVPPTNPGHFATGYYGLDYPTAVDIIVRNVSQVKAALYDIGLDMEMVNENMHIWDYIPETQPIREWSLPVDSPQDEIGVEHLPLADGEALPTGVYFLRITSPETEEAPPSFIEQREEMVLIVAEDNVVVKETPGEIHTWVTTLTDGQIDANREVRLFNRDKELVATAVTDNNGFATFTKPQEYDHFYGYTVISGEPGEEGFGIGRSNWDGHIPVWDMVYSARSHYSMRTTIEDPAYGYVYSDRPLYRPGDTIHFKGIVRDANYGRYEPPGSYTPTLHIYPYGYNEDGLRKVIPVELDAYGHFSGEFMLPEETALGSYLLYMDITEDGYYESNSYRFTIADYRKPDFLIEMVPDESELLRGEATAVALQAEYFSGGGVAEASVDWYLRADPFVPEFEGDFYYFGDGSAFNFSPYSLGYDRLGSGSSVTDENGRLTIPLDENLLAGTSAGSKVVTVEAQVGGLGEFPVTSYAEIVMHAADGYVGVVAQERLVDSGQETAVNLITLDWAGQPLPNRAVEVVFYQREWVSERMHNESEYYTRWTPVDTEIERTQVTTGEDGRTTAAFTPEEGGSYIAVATYTDEAGRVHSSNAPFWVRSPNYQGWRTDAQDRSLILEADQTGYQAGDTAHILVQSPFPAPVQAWLTIERGKLIEQQLITLHSTSDTIDIPITADYAPNVFVSIAVVKGVTPESDYPWPDIRFGAVELPVSTEALELTVKMTPQETQLQPGETAVYDINVTDYQGNPVRAELSLALVDLAVLSLKPDTTDIVKSFYQPEPYRSLTGSGLFLSGEGLVIEPPLREPGHMGGGGGDLEEGALSGTPEDNEARSNFKDTAYWSAQVETDANGRAHVEIELPDNATTWRLSSKAISLPPEDGSLVGQSAVDIVTSLPLLLRPVTPRFFTVADELQIMAMVQNNTDETLETAVSLTAEGLTIQDAVEKMVTIEPHGQALVQWQTAVEDVAFVDLTFVADSGSYRDASKPYFGIAPDQLLPVYRYDGRDVVGTSGVVGDDNRRVEAILLPDGVNTRHGTVETVLNGSLGAAIFESMAAREPYSWEKACASSITDRLLPNTAVARAIAELELDEAALQAELDQLIPADVAALEHLRVAGGGWGWCYSGESHPWLTAYALLALVQAEQAGYPVNEGSMTMAAAYLTEVLAAMPEITNPYAANQQAFFLYVLAAQGQDVTAELDTLVTEYRALLDPYAKGYLLMAYTLTNANSPQQQTLLSDLNGSVVVSAAGAHWEDMAQDYGNLNSDVRGTAVIIQALSLADPDNQMIPSAVRWLMSARTALNWSTTHETAWSLAALTDWALASGDFEADYAYALLVNREERKNGHFAANNLSQSIVNSVPISDLSLTEPNFFDYQKDGAGNLYYTTHMDSYISVAAIEPVNRGISVQRYYYDAACDRKIENCQPITQIEAGQKVRVELDIIAVNDLVYATIEDPIPAGAEAIDPNLNTSPSGYAGGMESSQSDCWGCWGWWYFNRIEYRDEAVVFLADFLPTGTYRYTYTLQTNIRGTYQVMPTFASETYFPEVNGRSAGLVFVIE